ncbi:hypothetical protein GCM10027259_35310 [Micromonospora palomenae]
MGTVTERGARLCPGWAAGGGQDHDTWRGGRGGTAASAPTTSRAYRTVSGTSILSMSGE